jgi:predicted  nucleic acid-binding Zn-ribbon protein
MKKPRKKIKKMTTRETLDALQGEIAELKENQRVLSLTFSTLENRYEALETLMRHMQAAKLGHGPSVK